MSKPGRVIENLPTNMLKALSASSERGRGNTQSRALPIDEVNTRSLDVDRDLTVQRLMNTPAFRQKLTEQLSLPGVDEEIHQLSQQMPNTTLKNENFTVEEFKQQALTEPYSVVHIASHGVFGKTAETSFVMAYDNLININELESLLKSYKFQQQPISLITLSACQTAEGDDRAPLGLIGIALKANVGSALGSLWPVSDEAASLLMTEFYRGLTQPGIGKAEALRQAQIKLLKRSDLANPFYWSPFILAGNWL
ncbi:CHAT domain-containing protein [Methylocucumis oryzae]|uniref:CHAT domain-containing protein n=1 Tax=Methylocucumis oryzae TaxID=1632867 RepID=A0A0F3IHT5_9GAMM|nr:CHAT domain-containing protein [Methylocucumis oryzae]KJV06083.1 hypothetical protein VZ94_13550 [Methylocucumis oryzae]